MSDYFYLLLILGALAVIVATSAIERWAGDVDGIRSDGVPVSCWHFRESGKR